MMLMTVTTSSMVTHKQFVAFHHAGLLRELGTPPLVKVEALSCICGCIGPFAHFLCTEMMFHVTI